MSDYDASQRELDQAIAAGSARGLKAQQIDKDRGAAYGDFDSMASCAQQIKTQIRLHSGTSALKRAECEALDLIATKLARIACGDPEQQGDSWRDIIGYANLALRSRGHHD